MNITEKKIDNYELELTIEVEAAEFSKAIKQAVKMLADRVSIPGFRKGKVPQAILEQRVGKDALLEEASEILINKSSREALREKNLMPVTEPKSKIVTNEFVVMLQAQPHIPEYSRHMQAVLTAFVTSFANFGTIGIITGVYRDIVDKETFALITANVKYIMLSGILVSLLSAGIVGLFVW